MTRGECAEAVITQQHTLKEPWITIFLFLGQNNWGEKDASLQAFLKFAFVAYFQSIFTTIYLLIYLKP